MDRSEYPTMAATLEPGQAISILNERVRQVGRINSDFADWLQERRRLEEQYAAGLRKLAKRSPPGDSAADLGIFSVPWNTLTSALETLADSHHVLGQRIEVDVERPLRDFGSGSREMQAMSTIQGNLASMARDIENAQKKSDRLNNKGSNNAAKADSELEQAQSQWQAQAPYVFESLQALDEARLNHLRDVLTQFQTHEVDSVERNRVTAEQCLNVLLNVETADEIKTFAIRVSNGDVQVPSQKSRNRQSIFVPPSLAPTPHVDDGASMRSGSASVDRPPEPEKKSGMKGLKRLGTVLGRRRESKMMPQRISESPERKTRPSPFNSLSSRFGRSHDLPTPLEESEEPQARPQSPLRAITSEGSSSQRPSSNRPTSNGDEQPDIDGSALSLAAAGLAPEPAQQNNHVSQLQEPLQPQPPAQPSASESVIPPEPQRDNDGFSEPPPHVDLISQAEQEAADNDASQPQFKLDIRNAPIAEEGGDAALASMANTLKMQAPPPASRRAGTVRGRRDMRASVYGASPISTPEPPSEESTPSIAPPPVHVQDRAQSPIAATSATSPSSPTFPSPTVGTSAFSPFHGSAQAVAANIFRPTSRLGDEHDTGSIRSGRSLGSTTSQTNKHPELHDPGLNTSIIETVSAWFEHGQVARSVIIGEIALAYNPVDFSSPFGTETIRLDGFDKLEKVAPNPSFLSNADASGEYSVNLGGIAKTAVAFKYQVANPGATAAPLLLSPAWKVEATQTSAILSYGLNPAFALPEGQSSVTLNNVVLMLHLDPSGGKAVSCQSKPVGAFDKNKNVIYWQLGNISLSQGAAPQKLLARFSTPDGEAKPGNIEARWETAEVLGAGIGVLVKEDAQAADPFADEDAERGEKWRSIGGVRKAVSGTYQAR